MDATLENDCEVCPTYIKLLQDINTGYYANYLINTI